MNDRVDWDRYINVESRATSGGGEQFTPLGDPSRWGSQVSQTVLFGTVDIVPGPQASGQIIRVQTVDPYSRIWQLIGSVTAPDDVWALTADEWQPVLELTMGVGQNTLIHRVDLRALVTLASPWYVAQSDGAVTTRPWIMSGGIVARAWSARVVQITGALGAAITRTITTAAQTVPLAAGSGI